jgi:hypothetical protein
MFFADQNHEICFGGKFNLKTEYTTVSGDTVFYLLNNQFQVLYNFNVTSGDHWDLGVDTNTFKCSKSTVIVDSIGTVNINNHNFRWIYVSSLPNSSKVLKGRIIERFGAAKEYLFPVDNYCDSTVCVDDYFMSFLCYQDTTFNLYNPTNSDCEPYLNIESVEISDSYIFIYPNPANDKISILQTGDYFTINEIKIINFQGQEITTMSLNTKESILTIAVNHLSKGIYFLQFKTDKGIVNKKLVVNR